MSQLRVFAGASTPLTGGSRMLRGKSWGEVKISQLVFVLEQFELTNIPYISTIWHHSQCGLHWESLLKCSLDPLAGGEGLVTYSQEPLLVSVLRTSHLHSSKFNTDRRLCGDGHWSG